MSIFTICQTAETNILNKTKKQTYINSLHSHSNHVEKLGLSLKVTPKLSLRHQVNDALIKNVTPVLTRVLRGLVGVELDLHVHKAVVD